MAPDLSIGGLQMHLIRMANFLAMNGYDVGIVILSQRADLAQKLCSAVSLHVMEGRTSDPRLWFALGRFLRRAQPDIAIGWSIYPSLMLSLLRFVGAAYRVVATELNYPPLAYGFGSGFKAAEVLCKLLYPRADLVTANSDGTVQYLKKLVPGGVAFARIFNPVVPPDPSGRIAEAAAPWLKSGYRLLAVGRLLNRHKGFDFLVNAMASLVAQFPDATLVVVGDGPDRGRLERLISEKSLERNVLLPGSSIEVGAYLQLADIFVMPSNYEGFPNVLVEALMVGKIVVSSDCQTGPGEIVRHGENGFLFPVGDVDEFLACIRAARGLSEQGRRAMAAAAVASTQTFSVDAASSRYCEDVVSRFVELG